MKNVKYNDHVDLLYHTVNLLIKDDQGVNKIVNNLSKPRRNSTKQMNHNPFGQLSLNSMHNFPILQKIGLNTTGSALLYVWIMAKFWLQSMPECGAGTEVFQIV